jgi:hypothetical protein
MTVGDWFARTDQSPVVDYYEIVHQTDDGLLTVHIFHYHRATGALKGPVEEGVSERRWMEIQARGEVTAVARDSVPFLMEL